MTYLDSVGVETLGDALNELDDVTGRIKGYHLLLLQFLPEWSTIGDRSAAVGIADILRQQAIILEELGAFLGEEIRDFQAEKLLDFTPAEIAKSLDLPLKQVEAVLLLACNVDLSNPLSNDDEDRVTATIEAMKADREFRQMLNNVGLADGSSGALRSFLRDKLNRRFELEQIGELLDLDVNTLVSALTYIALPAFLELDFTRKRLEEQRSASNETAGEAEAQTCAKLVHSMLRASAGSLNAVRDDTGTVQVKGHDAEEIAKTLNLKASTVQKVIDVLMAGSKPIEDEATPQTVGKAVNE